MRWPKRFACPLIFLGAHTLLVALLWIGIWTSDDGVAVMGWILFELIDWPASAPLFPASHDGIEFVLGIMFLGGLQWLLIGLGLQRLVETFVRLPPTPES